MEITKEKLLERAAWHRDRAEYLKKQGIDEAYFYHLGRADSYNFLAISMDKQEAGNP